MAFPQRSAPPLLLQVARFVFLAALGIGLVIPSAVGQAPSSDCDRLYERAEASRERLRDLQWEAHTTTAERQRHRQAPQQLIDDAEQARQCYEPLLPPSADAPPPSSEDTVPMPASVARERIMQTYFWTVLGHRELDEFGDALREYETFFQRFRTVADSSRLKLMYHMRGYQHYRLGNASEAVDDFLQALSYIPPSDTLRRAQMMLNFGITLQRVRDMERARHYYEEAEQLVSPRQPRTDDVRELLGRALFYQGDLILDSPPTASDSIQTAAYHRSIDLISRALSIFPKDRLNRRARASTMLGEAHALVGDYDRAHIYLRRGQQIAERLGYTDELVLAYLKQGNVHLKEGALAEAVPPLRRALDYAEQGTTMEHQRRVLYRLASAFERQGKWTQAEARYRQSIDVIEEYRASLRATGWAAAAFDLWSTSYRGLVRVLVAQERYRDAFRVLERTRARHLQDARMQARITNELSSSERARFDSLTTALIETRTRLAQSSPSADRANLQTQEANLMAERRTLIGLGDLPPPSIDAIQTRLRANNQTLLSFFVDDPENERPPRSFVFVLTPDSLHTVPLHIEHDALEHTLPALSPMLGPNAGPDIDIDATRFDLHTLNQLHDQLIGPVAGLLHAEERLLIVPDGPLFRLPFSMLVRETPGRFAYSKAHYLIEDHPIGTELGTALITDSTTSEPPRFDVVALGQTDFAAAPTLPTSIRNRVDAGGALPPLPGVQTEMATLNDLFGRRRILLDDAATESAFYELQDETRVLHLASHALVSETDPRDNLFVLRGADAPPDNSAQDGLLFLHELERHRSPIPLVVLSGCSTARGLHQSGEGPMGLQYAFRAMGAQSTLSTLWPTDDQAAVTLTTAFYRHLQAGHPKDVALQRAQLDYLRSNPQTSSPFFWAAPVLYGNPRPLHLSAASTWIYYLSGGALIALVALALVYRRSRTAT